MWSYVDEHEGQKTLTQGIIYLGAGLVAVAQRGISLAVGSSGGFCQGWQKWQMKKTIYFSGILLDLCFSSLYTQDVGWIPDTGLLGPIVNCRLLAQFRGILPLYAIPSNCALPASEFEAGLQPSSSLADCGATHFRISLISVGSYTS
jgi:hypothetical protein